MSDLLAAFPPNRQAAIIWKQLCRQAPVPAEIAALGAYRTPNEIRVIIAAEATKRCGTRFRCPYGDGELPKSFKKLSRQRLYDALVENFGPLCAACGETYGRVIDHDHMSGLVRGLVCRDCNQAVERCLHADSAACRRARYLNQPPAAPLQLRYPARHRQRSIDVVREAILGFDIFDRDEWPSSVPADWSWTIPEATTLVEIRNEWWRRHPTAEGCPLDLIGAEPW